MIILQKTPGNDKSDTHPKPPKGRELSMLCRSYCRLSDIR